MFTLNVRPCWRCPWSLSSGVGQAYEKHSPIFVLRFGCDGLLHLVGLRHHTILRAADARTRRESGLGPTDCMRKGGYLLRVVDRGGIIWDGVERCLLSAVSAQQLCPT